MPRLKNPQHERFAQLIAIGNIAQRAAYLEAFGTKRARQLKSLDAPASRLANSINVRARCEEIRAENERECRLSRRDLLNFYADVIEQPAGTLKHDDRLCQTVERTTTEVLNSKGDITRVIVKEKLGLPSKCEAALGIREMCGWDKRGETEASDDVTELLVMIRKRSSPSALENKPESTQSLELLSSEPLPALADSVRPSSSAT